MVMAKARSTGNCNLLSLNGKSESDLNIRGRNTSFVFPRRDICNNEVVGEAFNDEPGYLFLWYINFGVATSGNPAMCVCTWNASARDPTSIKELSRYDQFYK